MDKEIDAHFDRLERALQNLIDSISKYHPMVGQATELHAADKSLMLGIEQVQTHQANHNRLQTLRAASAALDSQIKTILTTLAITRRDVAATKAVEFPSTPPYPFTYPALLSYARRISKTTLPSALLAPQPTQPANGETSHDTSAAQPANTGTTHALPTPNQSGTYGDAPTISFTGLSEDMQNHLNPMAHSGFIPWPADHFIRSGSLAQTQALIDEGIDPAGYDPEVIKTMKKKEAEERAVREEEERKKREEEDRAAAEERRQIREQENREAFRREAGIAGGQNSPVEKKQFHFFNLDDDDDDSD